MRRLILFELRKIFSGRLTRISLVLLFLISVFLCFSDYQNKYAFDGKGLEGTGKTAVEIDREIAAKYEGMLTDEKVREMMEDFAPKSDLRGMNAIYLYHNAMQSAVFARFSDIDGNWNGLSVSDVFGGEEIRIGYIDGWLSASGNMVKIFLVLSLAIIVMDAPVFSGEYGGVDQIILAGRYGRTKCAAAKAGAGMIAAFIVTLSVVILNFLPALLLYGGGGLECSILFAPLTYIEGYIPFNITCGTLLKYQFLLAFTGAMGVAGITLLFSAVSKNEAAAVAASAAVYFFPVILPVPEGSLLFRYIGLLPVYHAQFVSLMSVERMGGGILYAVWAVPAAFFLAGACTFASRRIFGKHEVS